MSAKKLPPMIFNDKFLEHFRIGWRVEQAVQDPCNPLLEPKFPWDAGVVGCGHGTVLKDPIDGKFKAWVVSLPEDFDDRRGEVKFRLTYLVSDDGVKWDRPELDICSYPGYPKTNILMDFDSGGRATYASVFIDPTENEKEPYEMYIFRDVFYKNEKLVVEGFNQSPSKDWLEAYYKYYGLYVYRSADGIHWRPDKGPIQLNTGDTCHVHRDPELGYVMHHKDGLPTPAGGAFVPYDVGSGEVRANFRRTSKDGINWTDRAIMMAADWYDHQGDQIMEVGRYPYGDGNDNFIGLTAVYHATAQTSDLQFAASNDKGVTWWRPRPRRACLPNGPLGDYGSGMIWPARTLIEHEGRLYIYYGALDALHGDIYGKEQSWMNFHGAWCRASWEVGRMWAAMGSEGGLCPGYLTTQKLDDAKGKKLIINAVTKSGGKIEAELLNGKLKPIPGFTREDCRAFQGDKKFATLAWKDKDTCPRNGVHLRLWITKSYLYGFEWV